MSESLGLTSHKSSRNFTGCGMLRRRSLHQLRRGADPRVRPRRACRRAVLGRLPRSDRAVLLPLGSGEAETGDARGRDGGIREELARG